MANKQQGKGQAENGMNQKLKRPRETPKAAENAVPDVTPSLTLEDETTCIICLESFKDPVIIHCGHSFCRTCITEYWKGSDCNVCCPFCRVSSPQKLLVPNRHLETIVQNYKEHDLQSRSPQIKKRCIEHKTGLSISSENDLSLISTAGESSNAHQGHLVENILECYKVVTPAMKKDAQSGFEQGLQCLKECGRSLFTALEDIGKQGSSSNFANMEIKIPDMTGMLSEIQEMGKPVFEFLEEMGQSFFDKNVPQASGENTPSGLQELWEVFQQFLKEHGRLLLATLEDMGKQGSSISNNFANMEIKMPDITGMLSDIQEKLKPAFEFLEKMGNLSDMQM